MKLLIGCDGTSPFYPVLEDLQRAGLPTDCSATVLTVAKRSAHARLLDAVAATPVADAAYAEVGDDEIEALERQCLRRAEPAAERLREAFPGWTVRTEGAVGRPVAELCERADRQGVDLVVVGSHDRGAVSRVLFGSTAQGVLARCGRSVRVARSPREGRTGAPKLLLATDGSAAAGAAKRQVARRDWPAGTSVRVLSLAEPIWNTANLGVSAAFSLDPDADGLPGAWTAQEEAELRAERIASRAARFLGEAGLDATARNGVGHPAREIARLTEEHGIDAVFLGAIGHDATQRFFLGSVAASVAAHVDASVEVVRPDRREPA